MRGQNISLNALSGIGCIRTTFAIVGVSPVGEGKVLMPCRALDAFGHSLPPDDIGWQIVLMPCRALDAFGLTRTPRSSIWRRISLNALSGIGCIRTNSSRVILSRGLKGLNALSGIGCIRTDLLGYCWVAEVQKRVLMPCRALDAFGRRYTVAIRCQNRGSS